MVEICENTNITPHTLGETNMVSLRAFSEQTCTVFFALTLKISGRDQIGPKKIKYFFLILRNFMTSVLDHGDIMCQHIVMHIVDSHSKGWKVGPCRAY